MIQYYQYRSDQRACLLSFCTNNGEDKIVSSDFQFLFVQASHWKNLWLLSKHFVILISVDLSFESIHTS